jgi:hypothetical protein
MTTTLLVIAMRVAAIAAVVGTIIARVRGLRQKRRAAGDGHTDKRTID